MAWRTFRTGLLAASLLALLLAPRPAAAQGDRCAKLSGKDRERAERLMGAIHPHDCCDDTLAACLAQPRPSRLVRRLSADVCRRIAAGQDDVAIRHGFETRGRSMVAVGPEAKIDRSDLPFAGDIAAPVEVVVYSCARCPFCAKIVPALHTCVTEGRLRGKAKLAMRVFPIRSHEHSVEGGLAMVAAQELGRFWEYVLRVYAGFDEFALAALPTWAAEVSLDPAAFQKKAADPALRERLVAAKREGVGNRVDATPTFFLSGRKYDGDLDPESLWDAIEEEAERLEGTLCEPAP
jgi:protein-disulfide isomerase